MKEIPFTSPDTINIGDFPAELFERAVDALQDYASEKAHKTFYPTVKQGVK